MPTQFAGIAVLWLLKRSVRLLVAATFLNCIALRVRTAIWDCCEFRCVSVIPFVVLQFSVAFQAAAAETVLPPTVLRDWRIREARRQAEDFRDRRMVAEYVQRLQYLLDQKEDAFDVLGDRVVSVRNWAATQIANLDPDELKFYQAIYSGEAVAILAPDVAGRVSSVEWDRRQEAFRRYFRTPAGEASAARLLLHWVDHGEFELATALLHRCQTLNLKMGEQSESFKAIELVLASRDFSRGPSVSIHATPDATSAAATKANRDVIAGSVTRIIENRSPRKLSPEEMEIVRAKFPRAFNLLSVREESEWLFPAANAGQNPVRPGSAPLVLPLWSTASPTTAKRSSFLRAAEGWLAFQKSEDRPVRCGLLPLVDRDSVWHRDEIGLCATDIETGRTVARIPFRTNFAGYVEKSSPNQKLGEAADARSATFRFTEPIALNSLLGSISGDRHRIYALDDIDLARASQTLANPSGKRGGLRSRWRPGGHPPGIRLSRFVATLQHFSTAADPSVKTSATIAWSLSGQRKLGGRAASSDETTSNLTFLGPPVAYGDELLVLCEQDRQINLQAIDPDTGRYLWRQGLVAVDHNMLDDAARCLRAVVPAIERGVAVCPTLCGVLVAYDLVRGELLWVQPELRSPGGAAPGGRDRPQEESRPVTGLPQSPVVFNGLVYHTHPGTATQCLDALTGKQVWSATSAPFDQIIAVDGTNVLGMSQNTCYARDARQGHVVWKQPVGSLVGRPIVVGNAVLLPGDHGKLVCLDTATGAPVGTFSPPADTNWGNLVACGDQILSLNLLGLSAFPQARARLEPLLGQAERTTADSLEMAELMLVLGDTAAAETALESALLAGDLETAARDRAEMLLKKTLQHRLDQGWADIAEGRRSPAAFDGLPILKRLRGLGRERPAKWRGASCGVAIGCCGAASRMPSWRCSPICFGLTRMN